MIDAYCPSCGPVRQDGGSRCRRHRPRLVKGKPVIECGGKLRGIRKVEEPSDEDQELLVEYWSERESLKDEEAWRG